MLFNSFEFIFAFLPLTLAAFFVIGRHSQNWAAAALALASIAFYGNWNPIYLVLLLGSVCMNYGFGYLIARAVAGKQARAARLLLITAVTADLGLLGYFKYAMFLVAAVNQIAGSQFHISQIILPLGISFFTFTQLAFLVDVYKGHVQEYRFIHFALFVTYFPHLIAGPVLHHKEMMPQFASAATYRPQWQMISVGFTAFAIGLFKKAVLADGIAPCAGDLFDGHIASFAPTLFDAWGGTLAYTLQLYLDFSGYSDMAIGLSLMFGIRLPLNFFSPYKAANISEFWRRWHMTLSRFLRDYLYIAMGGNRHGSLRRIANLVVTMLLGGLWHGAGWTYVIWGGLHGLYLVVNHGWLAIKARILPASWSGTVAARCTAQALTLLCVIVGWVFFRASSLGAAVHILNGMVGANGVSLPAAFSNLPAGIADLLMRIGIGFELPSGATFVRMYAWVFVLGVVVLALPNTAQLLKAYRPVLVVPEVASDNGGSAGFHMPVWKPNRRWAIAVGLLAAVALLSLFRVSEFLYYQF
jgi:D-alanyl-lipoteichoic acid acyltransferase DltB (MBOAT superfamily)